MTVAPVARPYGDHLGRLQQWGRRDDGEGQRVGWRAKAPRENHRSLGDYAPNTLRSIYRIGPLLVHVI